MNTRIFFGILFLVIGTWIPFGAQAGFSKATFHTKAAGCSSGAYFDPRNGGECWACPSGYNRTLYPVTDSKACLTLDHAKATKKGKPYCPSGSFFDPRNGGECWKCPSDRPRRTAYAVTDSKACATQNIIGEKLAKAQFVRQFGCDGSAFFDPRNGGECWSCPSGYNRTTTAVTDNKACAKEVLNGATFKNAFACPGGQFFDPRNGGECWSCGSGKYRTINPVDGTKACTDKPIEIFAADTKAICKQVVGTLGEGKKGAERLSRELNALIAPVMDPVRSEAGKLGGKLRSPAELDKLYENMAKHMSSELSAELIRFQANLKKAGSKLDSVLLDPVLMCEGTPAQIDKRLTDLGLKPDLGKIRGGALGDFFIGSAHAYSGQGVYSAYSLSLALPLANAGNWNFGVTLVTNFNGAGGVYFGIGQYVGTASGPSASVGAMIYPVASLSDFDTSPIPGLQVSFAMGDDVKDKLVKLTSGKSKVFPDALDVSFEPTFRNVPGFGFSKGVGGDGHAIIDLTGSAGWSFPLTVWGR